MRLTPSPGSWWRLDTAHPDEWDWTPYAAPRGRFDPLSNRFRMRYAGNRAAVAARERFPSRIVTEAGGDLWLVELTGLPSALRLTHQRNLDALRLDDRVSTGRIDTSRRSYDPLLDTCGALADAVFDWWRGRPPPLVYRSRTTPAIGRSMAFTATATWRVGRLGRLRDATALHAHLVLHAGYTVPSPWLG